MAHGRKWPEVIRPKALAVFVLVWNVPTTLLCGWLLWRSDGSQVFGRLCLLQAFLLGVGLIAVGLSPQLQRALFIPQADLLYVGGSSGHSPRSQLLSF